ANAPAAERYEARWFVKLAGSWAQCTSERQVHGRQQHVAVEIYNDIAGNARLYRLQMEPPNDAFSSRLDAVIEGRGRARQLGTVAHEPGSREAAWDEQLDALAGRNPRGRAPD